MSTMIREIYDALKEAGCPEEKAAAAAEALAGYPRYEERFTRVEDRFLAGCQAPLLRLHPRAPLGAAPYTGFLPSAAFSLFDRWFGTLRAPGPCTAPLGVTEHMGFGVVGQLSYPFRPSSYRRLTRGILRKARQPTT